MNETERALLDTLEYLESNRRATGDRMMNALTHLGARLVDIEQENTKLTEQVRTLSSLAAEQAEMLAEHAELLNRQGSLLNQQSEILLQLVKK